MSSFDSLKHTINKEQKTWLVTGVAGFIGSHLLYELLGLNQKVIGLDNFSTGFEKNINDVKSNLPSHQWKNFKFIKGDIRDIKICQQAVAKVDYVLHQAALGSVPRSIKDPLATNDNNVTGFLNILTAAKEAGVESFVYASSSSVYGDHPDLPKVEEKIGKQLSPYAVSKYVNELYASVYFSNYKMNTVGLRYFNVFGARQDPDGPYAAVIPLWVSALIENKPVFINGDGSTSRDFCYVANAVQANILAATSKNEKKSGTVFNVACEKKTTLVELYELLKAKLVKDYPFLKEHKASFREFRAGDIMHSLANTSKAKKILGYNPTHYINEGLDEALAWYKSSSLQKLKKSA